MNRLAFFKTALAAFIGFLIPWRKPKTECQDFVLTIRVKIKEVPSNYGYSICNIQMDPNEPIDPDAAEMVIRAIHSAIPVDIRKANGMETVSFRNLPKRII